MMSHHPRVAPPPARPQRPQGERDRTREFWHGLARAFAGALLFAVPILMTMETWWLGFYVPPLRLLLLIALMIPVVVGLSYYSGIKESHNWLDAAVDGSTALGVGIVASALALTLFGVLDWSSGVSLRELVGKIAMQAPSSALGAVLARSQLGERDAEHDDRVQYAGYGGELFFMAAGGLYLGYTVAATEEMILIAYMMSAGHALALLLVSVLLLHAFVYVLSRKQEHRVPEDAPQWSLFLRFTLPGYVITLLISAYVLWTVGRFESLTPQWVVIATIVLSFPGSVGAAVARLVF